MFSRDMVAIILIHSDHEPANEKETNLVTLRNTHDIKWINKEKKIIIIIINIKRAIINEYVSHKQSNETCSSLDEDL